MKKPAVLAALLIPAAALAAGGMKPGNYEFTTKMEMPGMPFAMPPMTAQHCLTQADIEKNEQYRTDRSQDCRISNLKQSGGKTTFDLSCKDGTTGKAKGTVHSHCGLAAKTGQDFGLNFDLMPSDRMRPRIWVCRIFFLSIQWVGNGAR